MYSNKSLSQYISSRKLTRLFWILLIILSLCYWMYFLYSYTFNYLIPPERNYRPLQFISTENKQYYQDVITSSTAVYNHQNEIVSDSIIGNSKMDIEDILQNNADFTQEYIEEGVFADITALIHYRDTSLEELSLVRDQIRSVLSQSVQPKYIWIICFTSKTKREIERKLKLYDPTRFQVKIFPYQDTSSKVMLVKDAPWLLKYTPDMPTEYTWILEPYTIPNEHYLYHTFTLLQSKEYQNTLVGYDTSLILSKSVQCQTSALIDKSHHVDMVHSSWLLRSSWIKALIEDSSISKALHLPLAYYISNSLKHHSGIPSVAVPSSSSLIKSTSCPHLERAEISLNSIYPSVLDQALTDNQNEKVAILVDSMALVPLLCRFTQFDLHIILTNGMTRLDIPQTCMNGLVHDLTMAYDNGVHNQLDYVVPIAHVVNKIQPKVLIHEQQDDYSLFVRSPVVLIGLSSKEINHALWISDLTMESLLHWNNIKVDLVVVTDKRPQSLKRLLDSINHAHYLGDKDIDLIINMDQTADSKTLNLVQNFNFNQGEKKVRHRIRKGGLVPAIVESWYPSNDNNYGLILEDDIELSPFFYTWTKYNILKYRYGNNRDAYERIYGVSLYSPRNLELLPEGRRPFNPEPILSQAGYASGSPYGSQIPCSWGAVYFPQHWREFHHYLTDHLIKQEQFKKGYYNITVPNSRSERWSKSWKKYFIELTYLRAYVMIYPNYQHFESFSTNHLEYGTHMDKKKKARTQARIEQFKVPLMQKDKVLTQLPEHKLPDFEQLPLMDLWGRVRTLEELDQTGANWHKHVSSCDRVTGTFNPKDILCPFDVNVEKSRKEVNSSSLV